MKVKHPRKPESSGYQKHRCCWGHRNPKNHLTAKQFKKFILDMLSSDDHQHIICPGCGRSIYLSLKIEGHNLPEKHKPFQERKADPEWEEARRYL